jgi:hypothetical protein
MDSSIKTACLKTDYYHPNYALRGMSRSKVICLSFFPGKYNAGVLAEAKKLIQVRSTLVKRRKVNNCAIQKSIKP